MKPKYIIYNVPDEEYYKEFMRGVTLDRDEAYRYTENEIMMALEIYPDWLNNCRITQEWGET
ncbi:MAG: hypothetical protein CMF22_10435 [Idiomarinaceae bacterium]|nr:hypothetical protein [Idiomarinaceae bacterium]MBG23858.1 hypothetical protein [Idiomarinaceae bacterium]|tara:strand:- start:17073 stop:17258 length:186 start_codon:yes stop_codon:yes gene_type:complete